MSSSEAYSVSTSTVSTKPRVREEVREEMREELRLIDMPRVAPEEKLRLERDAVEASVGEVELFERSWRKSQPDTIMDIERKVDALGGTPLPAATEGAVSPRYAAGPAPARPRAPAPDITMAPAPLPAHSKRPLGSRLSPTEQRAIAKHLGGQPQRFNVLFTTSRGRVVEVQYKKGGEARDTTVVIGDEGHVSTLDEIGSKLDHMAMPSGAPPPPSGLEAALGPGGPPSPTPRRATVHKVEAGPGGRTPSGLMPTVANQVIENVEGVGPVYGQKLREQGIEIIEELLMADADRVAEDSGISVELVRKWQQMGRLQAVNGIGPQFSELLVRAGIPTMQQLAKQTPEGLAQNLNDYETSLGVRVQGTTLSPAVTEDWIRQARELTGRGAPAPAKAAKPAAKPARKGFGIGLPKKAESAEGAEPKKKFGLRFGKK